MSCESKYCVVCGTEIDNNGQAKYCIRHKPMVMGTDRSRDGKNRITQRDIPSTVKSVNESIVTVREGLVSKSPLSKEDLKEIEYASLVTMQHPTKILRYLVKRGISELKKNNYQISL